MKKILAVLLLLALSACTFAGCGGGSEEISENTGNRTESVIDSGASIPDTVAASNEMSEQIKKSSSKNGTDAMALIRFPINPGKLSGYAVTGIQSDLSVAMLFAERDDLEIYNTAEDDDPHNIFTSFRPVINSVFEDYVGEKYINSFSIDVNEVSDGIQINGYDMVKFNGRVSYTKADADTYKERTYDEYFAAYSTKLHTNDAIVFWIVFDHTDDQSLGNIIDVHAENMAYTLNER